MSLQTIPLSKLKPSPHNVRKTGGQSITDLAASIHAHGLIQNLTVVQAGKAFEVVAGNRRLAALKHLAKEKLLSADYDVACSVIENTNATEISVAENTIREAMHPADQFEAFRELIDGGKSIADTAAAFGVAETVVKQRLKLANVSPKLLVEYRAGNATLEQMQALAISDDHAAQETAWGTGGKNSYHRHADRLRQALTQAEIASNDQRVQLVGLAAYEAAGGAVRRDLFSSTAYIGDAALLNRMTDQALERMAETLRADGWAWVETHREMNWKLRDQYTTAANCKRRAFTAEEKLAYEGLKSEYEELYEIIEDLELNDQPAGEQEAELRAIEAVMETMERARIEWPAKTKAKTGALVYLDTDGLNIDLGLARRADKGQVGNATGESGGESPSEKPKKDPSDLPQKSVERLWGERTAILRAGVGKHEALAALAATLSQNLHRRSTPPVNIGAGHIYIQPAMAEAIEQCPTSVFSEDDTNSWRETLGKAKGDVFGWLLKEPEQTTLDLLAFCAAQAIVTHSDGEAFARKAGINIADYWQVTEEWLAAQPKGYILAALDEIGACTPDLAKLKAAEVAAKAAPLLKDAGWLPKPLRAEGGAE